MSQLVISEIFGPTLQGEGALIGKPTVFVRTGGCDYRCHWCDTLYAVEKQYRHEWQVLSTDEVWESIQQLSPTPILITLSGGNPALQDFAALIAKGHAADYRFAMETQGSLFRPWMAELDYLTLSPKPPSSGMITRWEILTQCLSLANENTHISIKIVIANQADFEWAYALQQRYPQYPCYLQPCNLQGDAITIEQGLSATRDLLTQVVNKGWHQVTVLPQLHNLLWGHQRGV